MALLERMEIYFSNPEDLNDPMELRFRLEVNIPSLEHIDWNDTSNPMVVEFRRDFESFRNSKGICCFSECPKNTVMWSHYADSHRGICVGFDTQSDPNWNNAVKVTYSDDIPVFRLSPPYRATRDHLRYQQTKSSMWAHEKEWRFIRTASDESPRQRQLPAAAISRIILGSKISTDDRNRVIQIASRAAKKIELFNAAFLPNSYEMINTPI